MKYSLVCCAGDAETRITKKNTRTDYRIQNVCQMKSCTNLLFLRIACCFFLVCSTVACSRKLAGRTGYFPKHVDYAAGRPGKEKVWVFLMAGQSNMAGRGQVEPQDTVPVQRLLTINANGQLILAKEPLHFYEPSLTGLDCGYSFGKTLLQRIPDSISILLIPTAVGGSSIGQWLGDSVYRNVKLFTNFNEKLAIAKQFGTVKAVLWHQGESDANPEAIPLYKQLLAALVSRFRSVIGNKDLPVLFGELGSYSKDKAHWAQINGAIHAYSQEDQHTAVIPTGDLRHKGDSIHFNSKGQRLMGQRFAQAYLAQFRDRKPIR